MRHTPRVMLALVAVLALMTSARAVQAASPPAYPFQDSPYMDTLVGATPGSACSPQHDNQFGNYLLQLQHDQMTGIHWAYFFITWSDVEQVPGQYDFSCPDMVVEAAHQYQVNLMIQVQTAGDWTVPGPAQTAASGGDRTNTMAPEPPCAAPMNIDASTAFWKAVADRYRPGGSLSAAGGWNDGYGVSYFEVENEPDSLLFVNGDWSTCPKDYALYVSHVRSALNAVDPSLQLVAPALAQNDTPCQVNTINPCLGIAWLDQVLRTDPASLTWASDQYRAAVTGGQPIVGAGPSVAVYSFHEDNPDVTSTVLSDRPAAIRALLSRYATQAYPTQPQAPIWDTEGDLVTRDSNHAAYAWGSAQMAMELLAAGVTRFNFDWGTQEGDSGATLATDPSFLSTKALTAYFPSGHGVSNVSAAFTASAGQTVDAYAWTNPTTGLVSRTLWAEDEPSGSGTSGTPFTVDVPVTTPYAIVVGSDWSQTVVPAHAGSVAVSLQRGDPSPTVMVVETNSPTVSVAEAPLGTGALPVGAAAALAAVYGRRRARRSRPASRQPAGLDGAGVPPAC